MTAFIAAALVLIAAYFVQMRIFRRHVFDDLTFTEKLDETEVTVGDDIYLYEEITNDKGLPIPYLKATSTLPDGLVFRLTEISGAQDRKGRVVMDRFTPTVDSMFVVKGHQRITRRWRITCVKRGVYTLGGALVVSNDLIGFNPVSKQIDPPTGKSASVTVLPAPVDLEREFTSSRYFSGDVVVEKSLLSDPLLRAGVRDYTPGDPMRRINWKSTAAHGRLLVNVEEKVQKLQANIIVNMCSHMIEPDPEIPGAPEFIEYNITVAATLIGRFASENVPVRLIANTPPETIHSDFTAGEDETGKKILVTPPFSGKYGVLDAMRVLAELKNALFDADRETVRLHPRGAGDIRGEREHRRRDGGLRRADACVSPRDGEARDRRNILPHDDGTRLRRHSARGEDILPHMVGQPESG